MLAIIALIKSVSLRFWIWWIGELDLLFSLIRKSWRSSPQRVLRVDHENWIIIDSLSAGQQEIARIPIKDLDGEIETFARLVKRRQCSAIIIQFSSDLGLRRVICLPLAAKIDLAQLLLYELDRLTPFSADEVYLSWRVIETDKARRQIKVELATVPKATIDRVISTTAPHHLSIKRVELEGAQEHDFSDCIQVIARRSFIHRKLPSIVILACLVSVAMVSLKMLDQQSEIELLDIEVTSVRGQVDEYSTTRNRYEQFAETVEFVKNSKAGKLTMTEILAELTELIPDQAFLIQLIIHHDTIQLHGLANKASALLTALERSPIFNAPRFDSPVIMDSDSGRERFQLMVQTVTSPN